MGTLDEDFDIQVKDLMAAVTSRDAWQACKHLMKLGGEIAGLLAVGYAGLIAIGAVSVYFPPLGLGFAVGGAQLAIRQLLMLYPKLDTDSRKAVRVLVAFTRKAAVGV